jgi:two-component system sensor histidine kinase DesK
VNPLVWGRPRDESCDAAPYAPEATELRARMRRRWRMFAGIFLVYLGYALPDLWEHQGWPGRIGGLALLGGFVALYLGPLPVVAFAPRSRQRLWVLAAMFGLTAVHLAFVGGSGIVLVTYDAIALVLLAPPPVSVPLLAVFTLSVAYLPQRVESWDAHGLQLAAAGSILLVSLAMYGMRANFASTAALFQARGEVRRLAAEEERLRISRDLHDLLGHALTTVSVKAELAARLVTRDPSRAVAEMTEVAELARQGLADVRAAVSGYREMSLLGELASAREVLAAAGMSAELPAAVENVPSDARELFGWAVREGITNAVRHSRATRVRVVLTPSSLEVIDDGRGPVPNAAGVGTGSGLVGLAERAAVIGGTLSAGSLPDGGYRLRIETPPPAAPSGAGPAEAGSAEAPAGTTAAPVA